MNSLILLEYTDCFLWYLVFVSNFGMCYICTVLYSMVLRAYRDMYHSLCIGEIPVCWCIVSALPKTPSLTCPATPSHTVGTSCANSTSSGGFTCRKIGNLTLSKLDTSQGNNNGRQQTTFFKIDTWKITLQKRTSPLKEEIGDFKIVSSNTHHPGRIWQLGLILPKGRHVILKYH